MHWIQGGHSVSGTYRTASPSTAILETAGVTLVHCDLDDTTSINRACDQLASAASAWDALVVCPGTLEPLGDFESSDFDSWATSINRNFVAQMRCVRALLPSRDRENPLGACLILWAGGGTNGAPTGVSAYSVSKIATIKMAELLDAELPDLRVTAVGPGWVRTKIHDEMLKAGPRAGDGYHATVARLERRDASLWTSLAAVIACCDWILSADRTIVGGRNFSVVHDAWSSDALCRALATDRDMYKLRRHNNDWRP